MLEGVVPRSRESRRRQGGRTPIFCYDYSLSEIQWLFLEVDKSSGLVRRMTENGVENVRGQK